MRHTEFLTRRVSRLADSLTTLKDHVREAVATELAQAIGRAVQDILGEFARGAAEKPAARVVERDAWEDDVYDENDPPRPVEMPSSLPRPPDANGRWLHGLIVGSGLTRWWLARGGPAWLGGLLGLGAGIAAAWGGPFFQSGVRVLVLAAELVAHGHPHLLN